MREGTREEKGLGPGLSATDETRVRNEKQRILFHGMRKWGSKWYKWWPHEVIEAPESFIVFWMTGWPVYTQLSSFHALVTAFKHSYPCDIRAVLKFVRKFPSQKIIYSNSKKKTSFTFFLFSASFIGNLSLVNMKNPTCKRKHCTWKCLLLFLQ